MPQYLEFASSQWNRSPRTTFSRRTLGASPVAVRNPGPEKSYEAPDNFPAPGLLHVSPVVTGASASVGSLLLYHCSFAGGRRPCKRSTFQTTVTTRTMD